MNWRKVAILPILFIFIAFIAPHYILPLLSNIIGFTVFRGLHGIQIYIGVVVIPIPIFVSPDSYTFVGFFISSLTAILYLLHRDSIRMRRALRRQITSLTTLTASYARTGMPVLEALNESSKVLGEPLHRYVARFVELIKLGYSLEDSFEESFSSFPGDVRVPLAAIAIAIGSGGRIAEILSAAERYTLYMSRLEEFRKSRLEGYKAVLILAIIAFTVSTILSLTIISYISKTLYATGIMGRSLNLPLISTMYYIPAMLIVITSSIAISRIVYGETTIAFKYTSILSPIISTVFAIATHLL